MVMLSPRNATIRSELVRAITRNFVPRGIITCPCAAFAFKARRVTTFQAGAGGRAGTAFVRLVVAITGGTLARGCENDGEGKRSANRAGVDWVSTNGIRTAPTTTVAANALIGIHLEAFRFGTGSGFRIDGGQKSTTTSFGSTKAARLSQLPIASGIAAASTGSMP